ncbi:hypothetical protein JHK84_040042 [Glycine max]|nr:hypothetical protein JHK85_040408 [Glycine max]KAG5121702.1 hypothetical protein JHK84_040042 [Glycine max]
MFEIGHHSHNHVSHARRDHQDSINGRSVKGMRIYTCKIEGRVGKSRSGSSMQNYGSTPDKIKFIDGSRETLKLAVRITDLWFVGTPNKSEQAEMVIVDSNFLAYLNETENDGPMVIILTHARIKEGQGKSDVIFASCGSYPPSVSNSLKASKLLINEPVLEIQEFSERKTDIEATPFTCGCGKYNDQPVLRYRLKVMVKHKDESTKFLLRDRECAELIGQSANEVNRVKIEACSKVDSPNLDCNDAPQVESVLILIFFSENEHCESLPNQPTINTEGYSRLSDQVMQYRYCNAKMWYNERISKHKNCVSPRFSLCCGDDKVELPLLQNPPKHLQRLLFDDNTIDSKNYQHNIWAYNMMFAFTSAGIKLDKSINDSIGPPTIRIQGQPCHRIGSLLPMPGKEPKFAQLYIFDTKNEVQNRINAMR